MLGEMEDPDVFSLHKLALDFNLLLLYSLSVDVRVGRFDNLRGIECSLSTLLARKNYRFSSVPSDESRPVDTWKALKK